MNRAAPLIASGLACVAGGAGLAWAAYTRHPGLDLPPSVALVAAFVLVAAGLRLAQLARYPDSPGDGFAVAILGGMAAIGGWIALGPGERACRTGYSFFAMAPVAGAECRVPFGIGAAITLAMALYALSRWRRRRRSVHAPQ